MPNLFELMCDSFIAKLKSEVPIPMPTDAEATIRMAFLAGATSTMETIETISRAGDSERGIGAMRSLVNDKNQLLAKMQRGKEDECGN